MAGVSVFAQLFRKFKRSRPPVASLIRAWRYRLAAGDRFDFAAAFDAFPFTGALQKLETAFRFTRGEGGLQDDKVPIRVHKLVVRERAQLASHNLDRTQSMGCHVIEHFVLKIAHDDPLKIDTPDC
jgi:hypothetical protein